MKGRSLACLSVGLCALTIQSCSKALTASSAVGNAQKFIDDHGDGGVNTFAGELTNQIGAEMPQHWTNSCVQRLIKIGYLQERTATTTYPNLTGEFKGTHTTPFASGFVDTLSLRTAPTNPPRVEGSFRFCLRPPNTFYGTCNWGPVTGVVMKYGAQTRLSMKTSMQWIYRSDAEMNVDPLNLPSALGGPLGAVGGTSPLAVTLERGNPDNLVGSFETAALQLHGNAAKPDIQREVFVYSWTDKLPRDTFNGSLLQLGHLVIDTCDNLLLSSETSATASCSTHIKLTDAAKIIFGERPTTRSLRATFGKQPDGGWVCVNIEYQAPPFVFE